MLTQCLGRRFGQTSREPYAPPANERRVSIAVDDTDSSHDNEDLRVRGNGFLAGYNFWFSIFSPFFGEKTQNCGKFRSSVFLAS